MPSVPSVYGWGAYDDGQLGVPPDSSAINGQVASPLFVGTLKNKNVVKIACGYKHTLLLDSRRVVYSSGSNEFGQLGHSRSSKTFHKVSFMTNSPISMLAGPNHKSSKNENSRNKFKNIIISSGI